MVFQRKSPNLVEFMADGTVKMELTQGQFCIIDMDDYPKVKDFRWCAMKCGSRLRCRSNFPSWRVRQNQ